MTLLSWCSALALVAGSAAAQDADAPGEYGGELAADNAGELGGEAAGEFPSAADSAYDAAPPAALDAPQPALDAPPVLLDEPPVALDEPEAADAIHNADVVEMAAAGFGDSTIIAAIAANTSDFDVTPRALLALKRGGVSDPVIEAMLATKAAPAPALAQPSVPPAALSAELTAAAAAAPAAEEPAASVADVDAMSPEALAALSRMIEQLADAPPPPEAAKAAEPRAGERRALEPEPQPENPHAPRAWVADGDVKVPIAPVVAKVAYTDMKRPAATAFKTLQNFAGKALPFVNPALGAATSGLGSLFSNDDPEETTAVWALLGGGSARELGAGAAFEIEFGNVPGVDPDRYRPAIVQLVPTSDNYRLVGAARTEGSQNAAPSGPIIEEPVAADLIQISRGRYRVAVGGEVPPGEYALVLRPVAAQRERARERRRGNDNSLGEIMGGTATSQIIYLTWDFSITG